MKTKYTVQRTNSWLQYPILKNIPPPRIYFIYSLCCLDSEPNMLIGPGPRPRSRITRTGELSASRIWKVSRYAAPQPLSLTSSPPTSTTHTPVTIPHWNPRSLIIRLTMAHIKRTPSRPSAHKLHAVSSLIDMSSQSCTLR